MAFKFTKHGEDQRKRRGISVEDVSKTFYSPDKVFPGKAPDTEKRARLQDGKDNIAIVIVVGLLSIPKKIITCYRSNRRKYID
jgi:uncharacterized DUF497 family protein